MKVRIALATLALAAGLAACGGGDDEAAGSAGTDTTGTDTAGTDTAVDAPGTDAGAGADTAADTPSGSTLTMKDTAFSPASLTVKPGATVKVVNEDGITHDVTDTKDGIKTGDIEGMGNASFTAPDKAGSYMFECTKHPGMEGTLKVS